jgi:uncharacterized protein (DUF1800 family)
MGELVYDYQAPDGNPDVGAAWINSNALLVRLEFANNLATGKVPGVRVNVASAQLLHRTTRTPEADAGAESSRRAR